MYYIPDILGYRKSQARLSSALLESDPSAAISLWEEKNTSTQELKNGFLDGNQLTKSQKVESRVSFFLFVTSRFLSLSFSDGRAISF